MRALITAALLLPALAHAQDACPEDPLKTEPGLCGCGVTDSDWDADGTDDSCIDDAASVAVDAIIGFRARVDAGAVIGSGAELGGYTHIGAGAGVGSGAFVGSRTTVGAGADMGIDVVVGRRCTIGEDADIGADSILSRAVTWGARTSSGLRTSVGYGSSIGADGVLANDVTLGSLVTVGTGADFGGLTTLARGATLGNDATLAASVTLGPDTTFGNDAAIQTGVRVRKGGTFGLDARIGEDARVGRDVIFGDHARIGLDAVVGANVTGGSYATVDASTSIPRGTDLGDGVNPDAMASCLALYNAGTTTSGVYTIDPDGDGNTLSVYCEQELYGGGWTLISNRRQDANNIETCGSGIQTFFTNGCGTTAALGRYDSYALTSTDRNRLPKTQMLMLHYDDNVLDTDDAVRIDLGSLSDPFPDVSAPIIATALSQICAADGTNCDTDNTWWLYAGEGWFSSGTCTLSHDGSGGGSFHGNYGYCIDGQSSGDPVNNLPGGDRSAYQEAKLWGYSSNVGRNYQERIFYR